MDLLKALQMLFRTIRPGGQDPEADRIRADKQRRLEALGLSEPGTLRDQEGEAPWVHEQRRMQWGGEPLVTIPPVGPFKTIADELEKARIRQERGRTGTSVFRAVRP